MDEQSRERFKAILLERPGRSVGFAARELGIDRCTAGRLATEGGLATQRERIRKSGRAIAKLTAIARQSESRRIIALRPGLMIHFDASVIGRFVPAGESRPRELVVYSAVDRCTGYGWAWCCSRICGDEAAAALRSFATNSPFDWRGAAIVVDGRHDVQSGKFRRACVELGLVRRGLAGGRSWSNALVEQQHRVLRFSGFGALPADQLQTWEAIVDYVGVFTREINADRSTICARGARISPAEILRGMAELSQLPAIERAIACRLFSREDLETAQPMELTGGHHRGHLFRPLAGKLQAEHLASMDLSAVLIRRPRRDSRTRPAPPGCGSIQRLSPGVYLYV